jgi:hypothetical protein
MTTFWIVLALAAAAWLVARLVVTLRRDGLGTNPPPSSHAAWSDTAADLPSRPFSSPR